MHNKPSSQVTTKSQYATNANAITAEVLGTTATNPGLEADYLMPPIDSTQKRRECMCETRLIFICDALNI